MSDKIIFPKTLKIGAHDVKILYPHKFIERTDINGQYDKDVNEIRITNIDAGGNQRAASEIWVTFFHEVLHVIDFTTGHRMFQGEHGESRIEGLSEGLYQVLNDNNLLKTP